MLHEVLLALSGHPSPLLRANCSQHPALAAVSVPERHLLAKAAHISDLNIKLSSHTAQLSSEHPSTICRAVSAAIQSVHLAAFQRKVLQVEETILRKDAQLVGVYNTVSLTAVLGEFSDWTRRLEWLWEMTQYMQGTGDRDNRPCCGSQLIDRLRAELQSGFVDIAQVADTLVTVAETSWLKQVSTWIFYGRLPSHGGGDFFVQPSKDGDQDYIIKSSLLPRFVTEATAASMLFIGKSLNHVRVKRIMSAGLQGLNHISLQLKELSLLTYPLEAASLSRAINTIRLNLATTTLHKLLPPSKVVEILQLLRDFFLLGRGEFAMALTQQADEKIRSRWKRAENLAHEQRVGLGTFALKGGEIASVLGKTWTALGLMQGQHAEEDDEIDLARSVLRLNLPRPPNTQPHSIASHPARSGGQQSAEAPFQTLLFSVPVVLTMQIPSPLDMFLAPSDVQKYSSMNSYLLSIRRAHLRLTDLWKMTGLRRHHPAPPAPPHGSTRHGRARVELLRERQNARLNVMRSTWVTASAAIFFLAETEAYLQTEVIAGLWEGFLGWLTSSEAQLTSGTRFDALPSDFDGADMNNDDYTEDDDIWLSHSGPNFSLPDREKIQVGPSSNDLVHDPETVANAHARYLQAISHRILLTSTAYSAAMFTLLVNIDQLVALVRRLHDIWTSMDLEADAGVVDAFVGLEPEETTIKTSLLEVQRTVKSNIHDVIEALRALENDPEFTRHEEVGITHADDGGYIGTGGEYVPRRVGGIERLLMKLSFGSWFGDHMDSYELE